MAVGRSPPTREDASSHRVTLLVAEDITVVTVHQESGLKFSLPLSFYPYNWQLTEGVGSQLLQRVHKASDRVSKWDSYY